MKQAAPAPALPDSEPPPPDPTPSPTSRPLWVVAYLAAGALLVARSTTLRGVVFGELERSEMASAITDENLESLAVNVGVFLGVLLSLGVVLLYFSLAATAERHIFTRSLVVGRWRFGLFFTIAVLCTLPVHAVALAGGYTAPRDHPMFHAYVLLVVAGSLLLFRRQWIGVPRARLGVLVAVSLGVAILSVGT